MHVRKWERWKLNWGFEAAWGRPGSNARSESWNSVENEKVLKEIPDAFLFLMPEKSCSELRRGKHKEFKKTIRMWFKKEERDESQGYNGNEVVIINGRKEYGEREGNKEDSKVSAHLLDRKNNNVTNKREIRKGVNLKVMSLFLNMLNLRWHWSYKWKYSINSLLLSWHL